MFDPAADARTPIPRLLEHAAVHHPRTEIVSRAADGRFERTSWADVAARARRVAAWLGVLGVRPGDRVATLAWNHHRHLELYFAVPGVGAVLHPIHVRPGSDRLAPIVAQAGDGLLFYDDSFRSLIDRVRVDADAVRLFVPLRADSYDRILADQPEATWPDDPSDQQSHLCHEDDNRSVETYSHHTVVERAAQLVSGVNPVVVGGEAILCAAPMMGGIGWGIPYAAALAGSTLVLPGHALDGRSLHAAIEEHRVKRLVGPASLWWKLHLHLRTLGAKLTCVRTVAVGEDALPAGFVHAWEGRGVRTVRVPGACNNL